MNEIDEWIIDVCDIEIMRSKSEAILITKEQRECEISRRNRWKRVISRKIHPLADSFAIIRRLHHGWEKSSPASQLRHWRRQELAWLETLDLIAANVSETGWWSTDSLPPPPPPPQHHSPNSPSLMSSSLFPTANHVSERERWQSEAHRGSRAKRRRGVVMSLVELKLGSIDFHSWAKLEDWS